MISGAFSPANAQLWTVYCMDGPDRIVHDPSGGKRKGGLHRMAYLNEHNAYQIATSLQSHRCFVRKQASVPMLAPDGITMIGSCFLVKASREDCERFIQMDPYYVNNVWASVSINKFSGATKALEGSSSEPTTAPASRTRDQRGPHNLQGTNSAGNGFYISRRI
ncbi:expressed unknown protein [Seminavis robusta]|uniref:YCII-related domain-containing protein n=1 Tax=Seminavis robusta TaxID=568900 RepID=A0A9N8HG31_9STRA|nr:expressed unknown protein [Seminavis robusta]|eukprot:Sro463_g148120.1 n/a (164) ;mRNA; r:7787-8278